MTRRRPSDTECDAILDELVEEARGEVAPPRVVGRLRGRVLAAIAGGVATGSAATAATGSAAAALFVKVAAGAAIVATAATAAIAVPELSRDTELAAETRAQITERRAQRAPRLDPPAVSAPLAPADPAADLAVAEEVVATPRPLPERAGVLDRPRARPAARPGAPASPEIERAPAPRAAAALGVSLLRGARAEVTRDPARALELVDRHAREFPSVLDEEREVIAIDALLRAGRRADARTRAHRFLATHPQSPYGARLTALANEAP